MTNTLIEFIIYAAFKVTEETKESLQVPLRKEGEERYDMCVYSGDSDDKCPDVIPDLTLVLERPAKECSESEARLMEKVGSVTDFGSSKWPSDMTTSIHGEALGTATFPRTKTKIVSSAEGEDGSNCLSSGTSREHTPTQKQWKLRFPMIPRDSDDNLTSECPSITFRQTDV